ncbi:type I-B CRISPR-associated protein Cas5b [Tunicatimonas pelagia]|uniref:type I-B CRISPR-associated protein Cas5b n=1 Tax=Tunicatimonas pelagia TaxID=931531 RepID=UPI00266503EE|nr:type I-B CRISPR-associated protein Cas5b [Tunicatimonas pelagia]WKN44269.1 type I-B CRISPR-associated protein Cas5b [Tunicatimonas pelagia]
MRSAKALIFTISGEYAHFRKFNTTSSPLTYPIPTPPALSGMLGAILGIERELAPGKFPDGTIPVNEVFDVTNACFGIQILKPIKKVNIGFNLLDTDKSASSYFNISNRTQIEFEMLKDVYFRVYLFHKDELVFNELEKCLINKKHHFTPYLGISQCTANLEYEDTIEANELHNNPGNFVNVITALKLNRLYEEKPINFDQNTSYATETMPIVMTRDRIIREYSEIIIEQNGKPINANIRSYWSISDFGNISFL